MSLIIFLNTNFHQGSHHNYRVHAPITLYVLILNVNMIFIPTECIGLVTSINSAS